MTEALSTTIPAADPQAASGLSPTNYQFGSTQFLFNRAWNFVVDGFSYTKLHIVFDIEKTAASSSNKAKIQVYNFSTISRKRYEKGTAVNLQAGYVGTMATVFAGLTSGALSRVSTERKGPDIITTFECGDGEAHLANSVLDKSYPPGTPFLLVVNDLVTALGLAVGTVTGIPAVRYSSGVVITGSVKASLDLLLKGQNLQWSVQNGTVEIFPIGSTASTTAIVINQNTGLIGVPSYGTGGDNVVQFNALLNPRLVPGALVSLGSDNFNGVFAIRNSKFEGDTHGQKWQVNCECLPRKDLAAV